MRPELDSIEVVPSCPMGDDCAPRAPYPSPTRVRRRRGPSAKRPRQLGRKTFGTRLAPSDSVRVVIFCTRLKVRPTVFIRDALLAYVERHETTLNTSEHC